MKNLGNECYEIEVSPDVYQILEKVAKYLNVSPEDALELSINRLFYKINQGIIVKFEPTHSTIPIKASQ